MATIELDEVHKRFGDGTVAIGRATLRVEDGEFFILVGPSGCGKSTLLNLIAGLEDATGGEIRIDGKRVNEVDPKDRNMAMVFQSYALYPHRTVRRNMAFPLELAGLPKAEIERRVDEAARTLGLTQLLDRRPAQLSGGQRQRVAMGRAIVREPAAFLMDEPLSNLDAKLRVQMRAEIARLQRRLGATTVYVTHDQTEALTLGDRIAVLRRGAVVQVGTPRELYAEPADLFVAGFIGSPAMNFLPASLAGEVLELPVGSLPLDAARARAASGRRLVAGIRPEDLVESSGHGDAPFAFRARVDVVEWLGSELLAHFAVDAPRAASLEAIAPDLESDVAPGDRAVARLSPGSAAREGEEIALAADPRRVHLFDADTGARVVASHVDAS